MSTNMYIKFEEPTISGSSSEPGHESEVEILSWSHGFSQPTSPTRSTPGSGTAAQATHQNLLFTKYLDTATNAILKLTWSGKQIGKVTITCYRASGGSDNRPVKYLEIAMQHVLIANYSVSGGPGDIPVENVSLNYGVVQYTYFDHEHAAGSPPAASTAMHNLETGTIT